MTCSKCGLDHPRCAGHNRAGVPCGQRPMDGQRVCRLHGGKSPQALQAADRRMQLARAESEVKKLAIEADVDATTALLAAVRRAAGAVFFLEQHVNALENVTQLDQLAGGGRVERMHVLVEEYRLWCDRLVTYSTAALRAGIDERRVRLEEGLAVMLGQFVRDLLAAPELGLDYDRQMVGLEVGGRLMRALPAA